jgi:hypothetical protein
MRKVEVIMVTKAETNTSFATCGPRSEYNKLDRKTKVRLGTGHENPEGE